MSKELREAGQRAFDEIVLHKLALGIEAFGKWIAVNLSDGRSDHVLYDTRGDAVRHQHGYERDRAYIPVKPGLSTSHSLPRSSAYPAGCGTRESPSLTSTIVVVVWFPSNVPPRVTSTRSSGTCSGAIPTRPTSSSQEQEYSNDRRAATG